MRPKLGQRTWRLVFGSEVDVRRGVVSGRGKEGGGLEGGGSVGLGLEEVGGGRTLAPRSRYGMVGAGRQDVSG